MHLNPAYSHPRPACFSNPCPPNPASFTHFKSASQTAHASLAAAQATNARPGCYVPQLGDEVVYCSHGHAQYLQRTAQAPAAHAEDLACGARGSSAADTGGAGSPAAGASLAAGAGAAGHPAEGNDLATSACDAKVPAMNGTLECPKSMALPVELARPGLRPFEPCKVVGLSYALVDGLSQHTVPR